jgi:7-carboxy-7-deazaguanine synthase
LIAGYSIQIETAGTVCPPPIWDGLSLGALVATGRLTLVCSPKTPVLDSTLVAHCRDWKYIIRAGETSPDDGLPIVSTQVDGKDRPLYRAAAGTIWVQPMDEYGDGDSGSQRQLANTREVVRVAERYGYRVSLQTHKILGVA